MNNMKIWSEVEMTDTRFVKRNGNLSAISGAYFYKRATEVLGPIGSGWGYDIVNEEFIDAAPMITSKCSIGNGKIHTLKILFWYKTDNDNKYSFEQYGHTRYMYLSKNEKVIVDEDYAKKSLTDAVKKALSNLGFCADVFLGMFEDNDYVNMVSNKINAEEAENEAKARKENETKLLTWVKAQSAIYEKIPSKQACDLSLKKHIEQIRIKCRVLNFDPSKLIDMVNGAHKKQVEKLEIKQ